jgi:isopentenyl diphosphate isomerase/L-lactate dehydrogenase-like FMN-dependent dehydrogenase
MSELIGFKAPELSRRRRWLNAALTIYDLRDVARRRTPRAAFDYADGGAGAEVSLGRTRQAFEDVEFHPSILRDVSNVDASTTVLGDRSALPFGIGPAGTVGTVGELIDPAMDPTISFSDLDMIRGMWNGKLVVKGVQSVADARS